jgi:hypothetical protein
MTTSPMIDVHVYDGSLVGIYTGPVRTADERVKVMQSLKTFISDLETTTMRQQAIACIDMMLHDARQPNGGDNYQPANKVDATDILADLLTPFDPSIIDLLTEQLCDVNTLGICNSGRVTRILQLWTVFKIKSS